LKKHRRIILAHGSGGKLSHDLIKEVFLKHFANPTLNKLDDAAVVSLSSIAHRLLQGEEASDKVRFAFTTDSYVVSPLFFPGGDIGKLSVCGTVNDLSMMGAKPLFLSASFIIEEGFQISELERILSSMRKAAEEAKVTIIAGDTKVVDKGSADGMFISTTGVGFIPGGVEISGSNARPGDKVIVSGTIGDHGIAILSQREGLRFSIRLRSDCAPLNELVEDMLEASKEIHCLRDPTRGGIASALNEIATKSNVGIRIYEEAIPIHDAVRAACEMLGLDPFHLANEGKLIAIVRHSDAEKVLAKMKENRYGVDAAIIGEVVEEHKGRVVLKTIFGASRLLDMLVGDLLPRIC
jgi:hydrogenase expression/formation protein HypE